jgi:hypothetical protein
MQVATRAISTTRAGDMTYTRRACTRTMSDVMYLTDKKEKHQSTERNDQPRQKNAVANERNGRIISIRSFLSLAQPPSL